MYVATVATRRVTSYLDTLILGQVPRIEVWASCLPSLSRAGRSLPVLVATSSLLRKGRVFHRTRHRRSALLHSGFRCAVKTEHDVFVLLCICHLCVRE